MLYFIDYIVITFLRASRGRLLYKIIVYTTYYTIYIAYQIPKAAYRHSAVTRGAPRTSSLRLPVRGAFAYKGVGCGKVA